MSANLHQRSKTPLSDNDISYVTDNEADAAVLHCQTGRPVVVRRWILKEAPYGLAAPDAQTFRSPQRLKRPSPSNVSPGRL